MIFVFNENGCRAVIEFQNKLLQRISKEIAFLEGERSSATELEVLLAIEEALAKSQFDMAKVQIKIREMEQHLKSAGAL